MRHDVNKCGGPHTRTARLLALAALTLSIGLAATEAARAAPRPASEILGEWWTEGNEGRVRFTRAQDGTFRGTATCCRPQQASERSPIKDTHNPNPMLRDRSTLGIVIIWDLRYDEGKYTGGYVYNPRDGKTYHLRAELLDQNTLRIRGYIGIPLLGQTQLWKRVQALRP